MSYPEVEPNPVQGKVSRMGMRWFGPTLPGLRRFARSGGAVVGGLILLGVVAVALLAPVVSPHDPLLQNLSARLQPPAWAPSGSLDHLLGTDTLGRDLLSRIIYGSRISLSIGLVAIVITFILGATNWRSFRLLQRPHRYRDPACD